VQNNVGQNDRRNVSGKTGYEPNYWFKQTGET